MTLRDLLVQVGGLLPTANDRMGFIQRTLPDGTPGELVKVDLGKALDGDKTANILLRDDDVLTVNTSPRVPLPPNKVLRLAAPCCDKEPTQGRRACGSQTSSPLLAGLSRTLPRIAPTFSG
jgi:hypothetical protein